MEREERREELEDMSNEETAGGPRLPPDADRPITAPEPRHGPGDADIQPPPAATAPAEPELHADDPDLARGPHGEMPPSGTVPPPPTDPAVAPAERLTEPREAPAPPPPPTETPRDLSAGKTEAAEEDDSRGRRILAIVLIVLGVWLLADQLIGLQLGRLWPVILIIVGLLLLYRRR
jgi:hypothetical protein